MSEHLHQAALISWARNPAVLAQYPDIDLLFSSLNGVHLGKAQAGKAKAAGLLPGVYDLMLPARRGDCPGLIIEMKYGKNKLTDDQKWFGGRMQQQGWRAATCWDWGDARDVIIDYLTNE